MDDFDLYRLFKTLHVLVAMAIGGGFVLEAVCGVMAVRAGSVQELRAYARLIWISENFLGLPTAVLVAVFGYLTADRAGYDLDVTWLLLGQALFYAIVVLALVFLRPAANRLHALAEAAPDGPVTPELAAQLKGFGPAIVGPVASVMFVAIVYLMVSKPAW